MSEQGARGDGGFYPIGYAELDKAFRSIEGDPDIEDCHPRFYGIRSAYGTYRSPLPSLAVWEDEEEALISMIDGDWMKEVGSEPSVDIQILLSSEPRTVPNPGIRANGTKSAGAQGFVLREGTRKAVTKRPHSHYPRYEERDRHVRSWKETAKKRRQFERHPIRIMVRDLTSPASPLC